MHFSELVKGICHLSAARRQIGRKTAVFWSVKKLNLVREKPVKSQGILFLYDEGGHLSAPLLFAYDIRHVFSWPGSYLLLV